MINLHYNGIYHGREDDLPKREPFPKGTVPFKEPQQKGFFVITAVLSIALFVLFIIPIEKLFDGRVLSRETLPALLFFFLSLPVHELLHAVCYTGDAYFYIYPKGFAAFVTCTEDITKWKFVLMCFLPSLVLGVLPYLTGVLLKNKLLCVFGAISIASGAGDFVNMFNAITQVPKTATVFNSGFHSNWYIKEN